jgi:hypothetical protein
MSPAMHHECSLATPVAVLTAEVETIKREQAEARADYKKLIWAILYASAASTGTLLMMLLKR